MIAINRNSGLQSKQNDSVIIKIVGIGGAGSNALDRMILDGLEQARLVAMNTDVQSLTSSVAGEKIQLGRTTTRGLGAGGDPELGYAAAGEAADEIRRVFEDVGMTFLCIGLGGGTGSGSAPLVASLAKEQGALVIAFVTMPFSFEGKRRRQQADEALAALQSSADVVICFENDKMGDAVSPKAGIHQAFANADQTVSQSVKAISGLFSRPGLIRIGFDDLAAALRNNNARCLFGYGESDGDNRVHDALARALKNPLMDRGRMLADAQNVLVNIAGGPGLTLNEVQILMDELGKHINDCAQILFGTAVDPKFSNKVSVTIISSIGDGQPAQPVRAVPAAARKPAAVAPVRAPEPAVEQEPEPVEAAQEQEPAELEPVIDQTGEYAGEQPAEEEIIEPEAVAEEAPVADEVQEPEALQEEQTTLIDPPEGEVEPVEPPKPEPVTRTRKFAFPTPAKPILQAPPVVTRKPGAEPRQETLQFEPVTRGRFEKSEPTIVDGQDLDVPTFLRRNVKVK
jgi:cell division protein FtsZ